MPYPKRTPVKEACKAVTGRVSWGDREEQVGRTLGVGFSSDRGDRDSQGSSVASDHPTPPWPTRISPYCSAPLIPTAWGCVGLVLSRCLVNAGGWSIAIVLY